jgi:CBS domain-containing protein
MLSHASDRPSEEIAMNRPVRQIIHQRQLVQASEQTTVADAARLMKEAEVGAILVVRKDRLVGIFTGGDALNRVVAEGRDPVHTALAEVMTTQPRSIDLDKPFGEALLMMHEHGFRHVPVVKAGRPVGVVSIRDALPPELRELEVRAAGGQRTSSATPLPR